MNSSTQGSRPSESQSDEPARVWPPAAISPVWVLPCPDLDVGVADLVDSGFRVHSLGPADDPSYAVMLTTGTAPMMAIRLDTVAYQQGERHGYLEVPPEHGLSAVNWATDTGAVRAKATEDSRSARGGANVAAPPAATTDLVFGAMRAEEWGVGRAGMRYRDLLPSRWGQEFIASHIHISEGGPVPDYVHFHDVEFQLVFCHRGWVRVVYEDQGESFLLHPGDAILQAPGIRHQVLEASDDLYVVEVSSPAEHPTYVEPSLELPNAVSTGKRYGGQDYVHFVFSESAWTGPENVKQRSLNLEAATDGRFGARVVELAGGPSKIPNIELSDFTLAVVLDGEMTVTVDSKPDGRTLTAGQSVAAGPSSLPDLRVAAASAAPARTLLVHRYVTE